jgi:hypothetical protein
MTCSEFHGSARAAGRTRAPLLHIACARARPRAKAAHRQRPRLNAPHAEICGLDGHNVRTCPQRKRAEAGGGGGGGGGGSGSGGGGGAAPAAAAAAAAATAADTAAPPNPPMNRTELLARRSAALSRLSVNELLALAGTQPRGAAPDRTALLKSVLDKEGF